MSAPSPAAEAPAPAAPQPDKRPAAEAFLAEVFRLMDYPVRLDFADLPDGSLGVAVHVEGEQPGITPGRRSLLVDSVQLLVNKVVNRPQAPRRWVNLGVNGFPEPRAPKAPPTSPPRPVPPRASAPPTPAAAKAPPARNSARATPADERRRAPKANDEATLAVAADPAWTALAKDLATKSATLGRVYAVMLPSAEDRARVVQAAAGVAGVSVRAEGEGHWRRVAFRPDKPTPLPKRALMPDYDDEDDEA